MNYSKLFLLYLLSFLLFCSCKRKETIENIVPSNEHYLGGLAGTTFDETENAFGHIIPNSTIKENENFSLGKSFFRSNWVTAGNSTTAIDGLGPFMNATSCSGCHANDGRGKPDMNLGLLFRLSISGAGIHDEPLPEPNYGGQLSHKAIFGVTEEGNVNISYIEKKDKYADGTEYSLRQPVYSFTNLNYGSFASSTMFSPRVGQQVFGLGLLEAVSETSLVSSEDPLDANNDGISGRVNRVWDQEKNQKVIGRLGWKANQPNLKQQTAGAFLGDLGLTSSLNPTENLSNIQLKKYGHLPSGGTPEVPDSILSKVVFYQQMLAVPAQRNFDDESVIKGKAIFSKIGCDKCHSTTLQTGNHSISQLANKKIHPYTDLLLHDMGNELADNRPDFEATGVEWRTPPLWGIGLIKKVNKHTFLLHDGRARSIEEAILWHGGEAENSKVNFKNLSKDEREQLVLFLNSL